MVTLIHAHLAADTGTGSPTAAERRLKMTYNIVQSDEKRTTFHKGVVLDTTRATAILIRQSRKGSNVAHYESRLLQESLLPFVMQARGDEDDTHIRTYDEGSGVSGTKGPDKRLKLRRLLEDLLNGLIGDIVVARADRLFRDKHFQNVSTFTTLAEKMGIRVIVPTSQGVVIYDFRKTKDLQTVQSDMQAVYAYIENQIGYMNRARDYKKSRGLYGGGCLPLPYVLLRGMPKDEQIPVIYDPWRQDALDLFQKFIEYNFEIGRIARYVESKPYLFSTMPSEDAELYQPVTNMKKVPGGYTFSNPRRLLDYLSNVVLGGYARAGTEEGKSVLIEGAFEAAIPRDLLEPSYAAIKGSYLDGTPYEKTVGTRQFRRHGIEADALLNGLLTSGDDGEGKELHHDDPIMKEHRQLSSTLRNLQKQRQEAALESQEDPAASIDSFYHVLSHLRQEFGRKPPQTKKDIIRKLVKAVEVNAISPHLYTLHITWIEPLSSVRDDVALLWRSIPVKDTALTKWAAGEDEAVRRD